LPQHECPGTSFTPNATNSEVDHNLAKRQIYGVSHTELLAKPESFR